MKKILFVILAVILILSIFATGCGIGWSDIKDLSGVGWVVEPAGIQDINIWTDESSPPQYFLSFRTRGANTCVRFDHCILMRAGNTIRVEAFNREIIGVACGQAITYSEYTIPLGSRFVPGETYTVEGRYGGSKTFVAGMCHQIKEQDE